jgi:hypothetical protein
MSQEEIDKEMIELRVQLSHIRQLLQREIKENQRQGWSMKKRVKWPVMQLFEEKLRERLEKPKAENECLDREGETQRSEFKQRPLTEEKFTIVNQSKETSLERMMLRGDLLRVSQIA